MKSKYTFVTVAHQVDYDALCFQARSMAKYLSPDLIHEIIIVNNGITGSYRHLLSQYGKLAKYVTYLPREKIAPAYVFDAAGWWTQQILKLMVAKHVRTQRYVCLDSKNVMVYPLHRLFLESWFGRPRTFRADFTRHGSVRWLHHTLDFYGLPEKHIKKFMPVVTPYTLVTDVVKEMVRWVEKREGKEFARVMLDKKLTEFFLYAGYLVYHGKQLYNYNQPMCGVIFNTTSQYEFVKHQIERTERHHLPFFSVHRGAGLGPSRRKMVDDFYRRRGIM